MKYRILKEEKGFRAQVELESRREGKYFEYIEEDGNLNSCPRTHYYDSEQDAIDACKNIIQRWVMTNFQKSLMNLNFDE